MNRIKRIITVALLCVLCMSLSVVGHAKTVKKKTVRKAYKKYIAENLTTDYPNSKYKYIDINKDGVEELIFRYPLRALNRSRNGYILLTYKAKKVYKVIDKRAPICAYIKKNRGICFYESNGGSYGIFEEYRLKGKKLKKIVSYYITSELSDDGEAYVKNTKIISRKKYEKAKNKYMKWKKF